MNKSKDHSNYDSSGTVVVLGFILTVGAIALTTAYLLGGL